MYVRMYVCMYEGWFSSDQVIFLTVFRVF